MNDVKEKNINQPTIGQLNINSIRNKFHFLESEASKHIDILLLIPETKIDESFPLAQFLLNGFSRPYRLDHCANGGGILLYVRDDISSCSLTEYNLQDNTKCLFIKINTRKRKWLFCYSCNPNKNNISKHLHCLSKGLDTYISQYDNIMLLGDLNVESSDPVCNGFCNGYNLFYLVKEPTCFKNPYNPSCIDLFLTNRPRSFQNTLTIETSISNFHKMVITVMKVFYKKQKPKINIQYRSYKNFNNQVFQRDLKSEVLKIDLNNAELSEFTEIFLSILDKYSPNKQKFVPANNSNFVTKNLRKAIMKRSKLRNKYFRERTNEAKSFYNKQRNLCMSILHKNKTDYFSNLSNKIVTYNRKFWKTISPLFSEKVFQRECVTLKESNKTITNNVELAETFNTFFSKIIPNLNIDINLGDNITNFNITDPVFCAFQKYEKRPSILKIKEMMGRNNLSFSFKFIDRQKIFNELQKLKSKKACQESDIPVKIIKESIGIFTDLIYNNFNNSLCSSYFPSNLKNTDITPIF